MREDVEVFFFEEVLSWPIPWNPEEGENTPHTVPVAPGMAEGSEPGEEMLMDMDRLVSLT